MSYPEARELIVPPKTQTYAQATKTSTSTTTQTNEKITQILCPPLTLLQPIPKTFSSNLAVSTSSTQANLLMSTTSTSASISETRTPIPMTIAVPSSIASSGHCLSFAPAINQDLKQNSK
ncbi:hypothetical protein TNCV_1789781 [Trichonephila clavipes]|nr:hypothetical protein TNCV_1789781 [Trichonephila clavipes]